jgi:hypothetical protein
VLDFWKKKAKKRRGKELAEMLTYCRGKAIIQFQVSFELTKKATRRANLKKAGSLVTDKPIFLTTDTLKDIGASHHVYMVELLSKSPREEII